MKIFLRFFVLIISLTVWPVHADAIQVTDNSGTEVKLEQPAKRIISLAPHATEMLFAVGAGEQVVGAVDYSDYPEAAKKIPRIGGYSRVDLESIVALQPDLVVAWSSGNPNGVIEKMQQLGLVVFVSEPLDFEDIPRNMRLLGKLTGNQEQAEKSAAAFLSELQQLREQRQAEKKVSVFYQIWNKPLMTVNGKHLISKVVELCGGENIFAELPTLAPQVGLEAVLLANPDAIVASGMAYNRPEWLDEWQRWPELKSVKNKHIFTIHPDIIQRHSPRILLGAKEMCRHLDQVRAEIYKSQSLADR